MRVEGVLPLICNTAAMKEGQPAAASPPLQSSGLPGMKSPTQGPRRRTLVVQGQAASRDRRTSGVGTRIQLHLSPLYFKPFFSYAVDLLLKTPGVNVSLYPVTSSRMSPAFLTGACVPPPGAVVLYFIAQPLCPDFFFRLPKVPQLQVASHYPRTELICDKVSLATLLAALQRDDPQGIWDFTPLTCTTEAAFLKARQTHPGSCWVTKADRGLGGQGIKLVFDVPPETFTEQKCLVQQYVQPPLLIEGRRFDLRVYVLVISFNPLRVFIGKEGVVHLCAAPYHPCGSEADVGDMCRHVTNYAVNYKAAGYQSGNKAGTSGNNRSFASFNKSFPGDVQALWREVRCIVMKTLAAVKPFVDDGQRRGGGMKGARCFELFGCDFILSEQEGRARPYLLEVNQFPSWIVSGSWFAHVKYRILKGIVALSEILGKFPAPGCGEPSNHATTTRLTALEDEALRKVEDPIFERLWPPAAGLKSWATADELSQVRAAMRQSRDLFTPFAATLPDDRTASLHPGEGFRAPPPPPAPPSSTTLPPSIDSE